MIQKLCTNEITGLLANKHATENTNVKFPTHHFKSHFTNISKGFHTFEILARKLLAQTTQLC